MKTELTQAVGASNAEQVGKARENAPSRFDSWGDAAVQLDSAGQGGGAVWMMTGYAVKGMERVVQGVSDILDGLPTLD